jgi:hypothetical protein
MRSRLAFATLLTAALLAACLSGKSSDTTTPASPSIGVISYWGSSAALYEQLPSGSLAVINPQSGIFTGQTEQLVPDLSAYASIVATASARNVSMLGYVPTGYFAHDCNIGGQCQTWARIEAQIKAYFENMPGLSGIFFDEASPASWSCSAFTAEYKKLRDLVHLYNSNAKIAFNAAVPDTCVVSGAEAGEIVVLFESDQTAYLSQAQAVQTSTASALARGVIPWHLVHTVKTTSDLDTVIAQARTSSVALFYATDIGGNWQAGENTWGSLPAYWQQEMTALSQ